MEGKLNNGGGLSRAYEDHPVWRLDKRLADILAGEHDISGLNHEGKVVSLINLRELWAAVDSTGWHTHTSDWDWQCTVKTAERTYQTINLPYVVEGHKPCMGGRMGEGPPAPGPLGMTGTVDDDKMRTVTVFHTVEHGDALDDLEYNVPVDSILSVTMEQLG